jgi:hypothetical protein
LHHADDHGDLDHAENDEIPVHVLSKLFCGFYFFQAF